MIWDILAFGCVIVVTVILWGTWHIVGWLGFLKWREWIERAWGVLVPGPVVGALLLSYSSGIRVSHALMVIIVVWWPLVAIYNARYARTHQPTERREST